MKIVNVPDQFQLEQQIQLRVEPPQTVTWFSSDTRVVHIDSQGVATPRLVGEVEITAVTQDGVSDRILISVINSIEPVFVEIIPNRVSLEVGQTFPFSLYVEPHNANVQLVKWVSSEPSIVGLDGTIATALRRGMSVISAITPNGYTSKSRIEVVKHDSIDDVVTPDEIVPVDKSWLNTDRIYGQYRRKYKYMKWFNITRKMGLSIAQAASDVRTMYDIDMNEGAQLDIIGRIVGVSRSFRYDAAVRQAQYAPGNEGAMYGDVSSMYAPGTIDSQGNMSDDLYRLVLKAKIVRNNNGATYDDILRAFNILFPHLVDVHIVDTNQMSYSIVMQGMIDQVSRWALLNVKLLPKPAGVKFDGFNILPSSYVQFGDKLKQMGQSTTQPVKVEIYGD